MHEVNKKVVFIGDGGKSTIIKTFVDGKAPEDVPNVLEEQKGDVEVDGTRVLLTFADTVSDIEFDSLRPVAYKGSDAVVIVFSVDDTQSLERVESKWYPEVMKCCPDVNIVLVGNKADLRKNKECKDTLKEKKLKFVSKDQASRVAKEINAFAYVECSAISNTNVAKVIQTAATASLVEKKKQAKKSLVEVEKKLVAIGDQGTGITCLLKAFEDGKFTEDVPNVLGEYSTHLISNGKKVNLSLHDTAAQESFDKLRGVTYANADVALVCFSVDNKDSFDHAKAKWIPEVKQHCPTCPIILVATKTDMREEGRSDMLSSADGEAAVKECSIHAYEEVSSKNVEDVQRLIDVAAATSFTTVKQASSTCTIL
eukprot:m.89714 g.89714  ORF g.89714 m.89714 type:complete len:369 (+) comp12297_c0_seq2:1959-3065(+)